MSEKDEVKNKISHRICWDDEARRREMAERGHMEAEKRKPYG